MSEFEPQVPPPEVAGLHPETGLYHIDYMPPAEDPERASVHAKQLAGEPLSIGESLIAGRDTTETEIAEPVGDKVEVYKIKPDHVYRAIGYDLLKLYNETGAVVGLDENDEYEPGTNNGVDWFLGGAARKYGEVVLETPADPAYFEPAAHNGQGLAKDPMVRHMKSSGYKNPVPWDKVKVVQG